MPVDRPVPLATHQSMEKSILRDLIAGLETDEKRDLMARATRQCETYCDRRLAPFVGLTETHRAEGAEVDELIAYGIGPTDLATAANVGYGTALGGGPAGWVRRCWVKQTPRHFPELWSYSDVTITLLRSVGAPQTVPVAQLIGGDIEYETGLLWFRAGTFLPPGSRVRVTYSGGYHTVPADLVEACRLMAAADVVDEDDYPDGAPSSSSHPVGSSSADGGFRARAHKILDAYRRS